MELPAIVLNAISRVGRGEKVYKACGWDWTFSVQESRDAVDNWLVATGHPLAMEPGTAEDRFCRLVKELAESP